MTFYEQYDKYGGISDNVSALSFHKASRSPSQETLIATFSLTLLINIIHCDACALSLGKHVPEDYFAFLHDLPWVFAILRTTFNVTSGQAFVRT